MADDEVKALLKQVLDFLPTLATKADVKAEVSAAEARLGARIDSLETTVGSLETTVGSLVVDVADLKAGQARLEADVSEIKRVVGVNHQRTMGHIEELRAILTDHLEGHDSRTRKAG
jgi:hypothetical protein